MRVTRRVYNLLEEAINKRHNELQKKNEVDFQKRYKKSIEKYLHLKAVKENHYKTYVEPLEKQLRKMDKRFRKIGFWVSSDGKTSKTYAYNDKYDYFNRYKNLKIIESRLHWDKITLDQAFELIKDLKEDLQ